MSLILDGVKGESAEDECKQFGLVFEEIQQSELEAVAELQSYCNMKNVVLIKAIDGLFVDQCFYVDRGVFILPGNMTFCYGDPVGALCRPPPLTSTTTLTLVPSSTVTELTFSIVSSDFITTIVIESPPSPTTIVTIIPGYTTTFTDSSGSALTTITVSNRAWSTVIVPQTSTISETSSVDTTTSITTIITTTDETTDSASDPATNSASDPATGTTSDPTIDDVTCHTASTHHTHPHSTRTHNHDHGHHTTSCHSHQNCDQQPDVLCRDDHFAIINNAHNESRKEACESMGMEVAAITIGNFMEAAGFIFQCLGPLRKAWIDSYNGDRYEGYCIAFYTGNASGGGAIAAPNSCHDSIPVLCTNRQLQLTSLLQIGDEDVCDQTAKGIHIVRGLYNKSQASDICELFGWRQLDIGNFNMLTFLDLSLACNVQFGWVRSAHGYIDPDGMLYFAQGQPVLGAAVGLSNAPKVAGILGPAFCQEPPAVPTSSATYEEPASMVVISETRTQMDTVWSTQTITQPIPEPTVVIASERNN